MPPQLHDLSQFGAGGKVYHTTAGDVRRASAAVGGSAGVLLE